MQNMNYAYFVSLG